MRWTGFVLSSSNGLEKRPKLRFPGFDEPWHGKPFGDLIQEYSDRTQTEDEDTLLSAAIEGMFLNSELFGHQRGASNKGYKKIKYGTMVLSTQNLHLGNANVNLRFKNGMVSPAYKTYDITGCSIELLAHWIKSDAAKHFFYNATTVGASMCRRNVEWKTLYEQPLFLPSTDEQDKIASFLSFLTQRIDAQQKYVATLKKYKRGLQNRFFFKRSHLSSKPSEIDSHDVKPLGSVVHINPKTGALPEAFIYIDLECVESGVLNSKKLLSRNSAPSRAQRLLEEGDLLYQMVRPYQKNNYYFQKNFEYPTVASTGYAQIRCSEVDTQFIYEQLSSDYFAREAMLRSTGTGYPAINADDLAEIPIWIPPLDQQEKIGAALSFLGAKIEVHQKLLSALCSVKSSLMQQLFI